MVRCVLIWLVLFFFHALHAIKGKTSVSQMLQECLIYETPWCTHNRAYSTITQPLSLVEVRSGNPWLAMLRASLTYTTDAHQLNHLRTAERPTGLIFKNGRCSLIYMNGCEL